MLIFQNFGLESNPIFKHFELTDLNYPPHLHRAFEIIYVQKGQLHVKIENRQYTVNPHQFIVIFPDQIHGFNMSFHTHVTILLFSPELVSSFVVQNKGKVPSNPIIFYRENFDFAGLDNVYAIKGFLYTLCGLIISRTSLVYNQQSKKMNVVRQLIDYVNKNYANDCTLQQAAVSIGYDYSYLSRIFKSAVGMTFTDYLNHYRISQAEELLKNTKRSITAISFQVGYQNLRTFNRNFQKITKTQPNLYRRLKNNGIYNKSFQENYISG